MPVPRPARVTELIGGVVADAGCELDGVTVSAAGRRSVVRVIVDSADTLDLDTVAELTRTVSAVLDAAPEVGEASYTLEVTTPGVDRPLTLERHWRRCRGRRAAVALQSEEFTARIGPVSDGSVLLVVPGKPAPTVRSVALTDVVHAVVEVEFSPPDPRELALSGPPPRSGSGDGADADEPDSNEEDR